MAKQQDNLETLVVDNFQGSMTIYQNGDINSGRSFLQTVSGQNPFVKPGNLTWVEAPIQIDVAGAVITDLILASKERVESGILYVYAIGHTGRLYKIQVNDPTTFNPDYDNPVLLTTLVSGTPTFTRGGFIDFFGATEKIYIGHDKGVTSIAFNGTGESAISGTWTQTVPRPLQQFLGKLYIGNGSNIAEIDSTGTVVSSAKLSPAFPVNTQVRDIDVNSSGTYLEVVVSRLALGDVTSATQDTSSVSNSESFIFKWNGVDMGYTSFSTFPSFSLGSNIMFQDYQYTFGTDQFGVSVFNPNEKILQIPETNNPPLPNAITSTGNILLFMLPIYYGGILEADLIAWGSMDFEVGNPLGSWDLMFLNATSPETDIVRVPMLTSVSNTGFGSSSNGYPGNLFGTSKMYFSTLETSSAPTTKYRFYKWNIQTSPDSPVGSVIAGVYQTQTQLFSKKIKVSEIRVYAEPWVANNSFRVDLIGSSGTAIPNGSMTFTAGTNLTIGDDFAWYSPACAPTYALGVSITNLGTKNFTINKIECDVSSGGR